MSQRGRGSGPHNDQPAGDRDADNLDLGSGEFAFPPTTRPIQPYDPYRSASSDPDRRETRNIARSGSEPPRRTSSTRSPFLDDDDPLNADAWQVDFDDTDIIQRQPDDDLLEFEPEPAPPPRERSPRERRTRRAAETAAPPRGVTRRSRERASAATERAPRPSISLTMPQAVSGASLVADPTAMLMLALSVVSIVLMALILGIRLGAMPNPMVLRLDAAGNPNRWGPPSTLWQLPLMSFFLTIMFLVIAWFLHPLDRFASRFALGSVLVAQLIAWAAILQHLFAG